MIFEEPTIEFVTLKSIDTGTVSGGTGGVDSCNGATADSNNCSYAGLTDMEHCGTYDTTELNEAAHQG